MKRVFSQLRFKGSGSWFFLRFITNKLIREKNLRPFEKSRRSGHPEDQNHLERWATRPTSGLLAGEGHIPLACSADPVTAAAITGGFSLDNESIVIYESEAKSGTRGRVKDEFEFSMSVTRIHEDPRVTKLYSDEQWAAIESLGHQVDADLEAHDVRMTMGGEPTFVSIDDMDGKEWNTAAVGPMKYQLASRLIRRLRHPPRHPPGSFTVCVDSFDIC